MTDREVRYLRVQTENTRLEKAFTVDQLTSLPDLGLIHEERQIKKFVAVQHIVLITSAKLTYHSRRTGY